MGNMGSLELNQKDIVCMTSSSRGQKPKEQHSQSHQDRVNQGMYLEGQKCENEWETVHHRHSRRQQVQQQIFIQDQIAIQERQKAAAIQAIYDVTGRTLCSFERYAQKISEASIPRFTGKYEKHKVSAKDQPIEALVEEMKGQLVVLNFTLQRYRDTPEVHHAQKSVWQWALCFQGRDKFLDYMLQNLFCCLNGLPMNLPVTEKKELSAEGLLEAAQHIANGSAKADAKQEKFLKDTERQVKWHIDTNHPDNDNLTLE